MGYAFISYSSKNQSSADAMRDLLKKNNIKTWMAPGDIPAGYKYPQVINRAVKECSCLILMLSNDAQKSTWVPKEIERALHYHKPIIPVQIEEVELNDEFEFYISTDQVVAVRKIDPELEEVQKVLKSVVAFTDADDKDAPSINAYKPRQQQIKKFLLEKRIYFVCAVIAAIVLAVTVAFVSGTEKASQNSDWTIQYQNYLQTVLDKGTIITGAWVDDVDGDGVPMVALSTCQAEHRLPNIIINYKDGRIIVNDDIETYGSGNATVQEAFFCEGSDSFYIRVQGNTLGTWMDNHGAVYDISTVSYKYSRVYSTRVNSHDFVNETEVKTVEEVKPYIEIITQQLDEELHDYYGNNHHFLNYNEQMTVFDIASDGHQTREKSVQMRVPVAFLEKELGIHLVLDENKY